jgi:YidC/Oxa1 family membrane protein insertase
MFAAITAFFTAVFYQPLYNGLIFLFKVLPWADAGLVVIVFTIVIKLLLFPLSIKATRAQMELKEIDGDIKAIKAKYKDNKEMETQKTIELYKEKNINPFASLILIIIQLPIIIALYRVFLHSGLPTIDMTMLYHYIAPPMHIVMNFLWISDISHRSVILAVLAGISTYFQVKYSVPLDISSDKDKKSPQEDMMRMFQMQMKFLFPILVFFISWSISAAVSLYWVTSNIFSVVQEMYMRKHVRKSTVKVG